MILRLLFHRGLCLSSSQNGTKLHLASCKSAMAWIWICGALSSAPCTPSWHMSNSDAVCARHDDAAWPFFATSKCGLNCYASTNCSDSSDVCDVGFADTAPKLCRLSVGQRDYQTRVSPLTFKSQAAEIQVPATERSTLRLAELRAGWGKMKIFSAGEYRTRFRYSRFCKFAVLFQ